MLGGSGVRLSHKDADLAPVLIFLKDWKIYGGRGDFTKRRNHGQISQLLGCFTLSQMQLSLGMTFSSLIAY